jgi:hypothetical protein
MSIPSSPEESRNFSLERHTFRPPPFKGLVDLAIEFFAHTPLHPLPPPNKFAGQGVYGLYYIGNFEPYRRLAESNLVACRFPIYIGKAVRPGRRKGIIATEAETNDLFKRLREHTKSIRQAVNIEAHDFRCRFMLLNDTVGDLIVPVESELIRIHKALWNMFIDGFGNHDPAKGGMTRGCLSGMSCTQAGLGCIS